MSVTIEQAIEETQKEVALTERWTQPRLWDHPVQQLLVHHPARMKWCSAARRSGKTEIIKRAASLALVQLNTQGGAMKIGIGAPTFSRAKDIYFEDLRQLIPEHWVKQVKESLQYMEFRTHWGASIRLMGMNNPKGIEGIPWDDFKGDEFADWPYNSFQKHLRPALATPGRLGSATLAGVPDREGENQGEFEKNFGLGTRWPEDPDTCAFWWPAKDILDPAEIDAMADSMDPDTFSEEVLGLFIRSGGTAFPTFNDSFHVNEKYARYCPYLPIDHTFDFGVRPSASLIGQHYRNQSWTIDEILLRDGDTDSACEAFLHRCGELGIGLDRGINVFGDAAGRTPGSATGKSDYEIIAQKYRGAKVEWMQLRHNPGIKDTVNAMRARMRNYRGVVNWWIHPRCAQTIEQVKLAIYPSDMRQYHLVAALRYWFWRLFPIGQSTSVTVSTAIMTTQQKLSARYTREQFGR